MSDSGPSQAALSSVEEKWGFLAEIAARHTGRPVEEERAELERALGLRPVSPASAAPSKLPRGGERAQAAALEAVRACVEQKFAGKLETGRELGVCQGSLEPPACALGATRSEVACAETKQESARLTRSQRRVMIKHSARQLKAIERRYLGDKEERAGVWSTQDYRRIRAAVQDASGRAAICLLYQLGSREAVTLAENLDPRVPMDRRRVAFAYAVARAPGSDLGETIKLGFAMGLWSAVLADPNNPNMERERRFRPSRRTLSGDLSWLQESKVLKRWQVRAEYAAPCEMKRNPIYPTNRYYAPVRRDGGSMLQIAMALGDIPPPLQANPSEEWTAEDAQALTEIRGELLRAQGVAELAPKPPD